jgi:hypothetical protein
VTETLEPVRVAMWSGPRNISTAMMRAFENRPDTAVVDEPFYAVFLAGTGLDHPMREEVLKAQSSDWREVVRSLMAPAPGGEAVLYHKHMTHHLLPEIGRDWIGRCRNAFLIRPPEAVLASYVRKREAVTLEEIGFVQQRELFEREADRLGAAPPVIEAADVLADPRGALSALCAGLGLPFHEEMLSWPAGPRPSDGVWAPVWYDAVERSTGFGPPRPAPTLDDVPERLRPLAEAARPHYQRLAAFSLKPDRG